MEIEEMPELNTYETMPTEQNLYFCIVLYEYGDWVMGPSSCDKDTVLKMVRNYKGVKKARIYSVKLPVNNFPP